MPNGNGRFAGGEWGSRTPVESREKREAGIVNDVTVPILLAVAISAGTTLVWLTWMMVVRMLGDATFWLFSLLASSALFFAPQLRRRVGEVLGRRYTHVELDGLVVGTVAAGLLLTVLGAYLSVALWKVTRGLTWWQILVTAPAIGLPVGLLWLLVSTFQESFFRSPFVEQAVALLIHQEETPWYRQAQNRPEPLKPLPRQVQIEWTEHENGRTLMRNYDDWPLDDEKSRWLANHIIRGGALSIPQCSGRDRPLSRNDVEAVREWAIKRGFAEWIDADHPAQGVRIAAKGKALFEALTREGA